MIVLNLAWGLKKTLNYHPCKRHIHRIYEPCTNFTFSQGIFSNFNFFFTKCHDSAK